MDGGCDERGEVYACPVATETHHRPGAEICSQS